MTRFITLLFLGLTTLLPSAHADQQQDINAIMEETGFHKLLDHVPDFSQSVLKQSSGALDPQVNSALSKAFSQAFQSQVVRRDVLALVNAHYNEKQAAQYLKQLRSPLAKKMSELERATSNPANQADFQSFIQHQQATPAPANRRQLIDRLDKANQATRFSVDMQTAFFKAVFTAVDPIMDADMRIGKDEMDKMVDEVRQSLLSDIEKRTQLSYLYAFRNLPDNELEAYIKLCESDEYRWGIQLLANALISALNQAGERSALLMAQSNQAD